MRPTNSPTRGPAGGAVGWGGAGGADGSIGAVGSTGATGAFASTGSAVGSAVGFGFSYLEGSCMRPTNSPNRGPAGGSGLTSTTKAEGNSGGAETISIGSGADGGAGGVSRTDEAAGLRWSSRYSAVILSSELDGTLAVAMPNSLAFKSTSLLSIPSLFAIS